MSGSADVAAGSEGFRRWSQSSQAHELSGRLDEFFGDPAAGPDDVDAVIGPLVDAVVPAAPVPPRRPPAPVSAPAAVPAWAADHELTGGLGFELPELASSGDEAAGGVAARPVGAVVGFEEPAAVPVVAGSEREPVPEWDRYSLWSPPAPEPLVVPDDVASIVPVDESEVADEPPAAADAGSVGRPVPDGGESGAAGGGRSVSAAWAMLPLWSRIAVPIAAVAVVMMAVVALLSGGGAKRAAPTGPLRPVTPQTSEAVADTVLVPAKVAAPDCPAGSSPDPTGAFDADASTAWKCGRLYGVDYAVLTVTLSEPSVITSIDVVPGFDYVERNGEDHWNQHRVVTEIVWNIGGHDLDQKITPVRKPAHLVVPELATTVLTATIQGTERPGASGPSQENTLPNIFSVEGDGRSVDETFAIGSIVITGRPASGPRR